MTEPVELAGEFARVLVEPDYEANGPRLKVSDLESGRTRYLDPLELATLTLLTHRDLDPFLRNAR